MAAAIAPSQGDDGGRGSYGRSYGSVGCGVESADAGADALDKIKPWAPLLQELTRWTGGSANNDNLSCRWMISIVIPVHV